MKIALNEQQKAVVHAVTVQNQNVFVSGEGGTGKSLIINAIREKMNNVVVCAPTGIASSRIDAPTMHSVFHLPTHVVTSNMKINTPDAVKNADVIIIDEISMVRSDYFIKIMEIIDAAEQEMSKHIIRVVVGDFYQLPSVIIPPLSKEAVALTIKIR